jgi:ADP-ribosylglycohydrolase
MRSHPYGLFYFEDRERAMTTAAEHSRLTHGAPLAMAASAALAVGVWAALRDYDPARIASFMQDAAYKYDQATGDMLVQAEASASDKFCETDDMLDMWRGWAGHEAIAAALFVFLREVDAGHEDVVLTAATSPGDSDSIASIAGALAGAFHGFAAIRSDWVEALEKSDELQALAFRLLRSSTPADRLYLLEVEEEDYAAPFPDEENTRQTVS